MPVVTSPRIGSPAHASLRIERPPAHTNLHVERAEADLRACQRSQRVLCDLEQRFLKKRQIPDINLSDRPSGAFIDCRPSMRVRSGEANRLGWNPVPLVQFEPHGIDRRPTKSEHVRSK